MDRYDLNAPAEVRDRSLLLELAGDERPPGGVSFGMFGGPVGVTDGRYAYYHYPDDLLASGLGEYTLMPMHLHTLFTADEIRTAQPAEPFDFTKCVPIMRIDALKDARRIPIHDNADFGDVGSKLFDLQADPEQMSPIQDAEVSTRLKAIIAEIFAAHDAPTEIYSRMKLSGPPERNIRAGEHGA